MLVSLLAQKYKLVKTVAYRPGFPLRQFVDTIWYGQSSELNLESSHYAAAFTELIFNFGDTFEVEGQNIDYHKSDHLTQIVSGLKKGPFKTKVTGEYECVGLIMKPFCSALISQHIGGKELNRIADVIYHHIVGHSTPDFQLVEGLLFGLFSRYTVDSDLLSFEKLISQNLTETIVMKDFSSSLSITQKGFIQKFKRHYLLTPNEYVHLRKVNYAIQLIECSHPSSLTEVALRSGFYDQSHFIRVFKRFCGYSPKKHLAPTY